MSRRVRTKGIVAITGFTEKGLENLRAKRQGPPYYAVGDGKRKSIFYDVEEVEEWMKSRRVNPAGDEPVSA